MELLEFLFPRTCVQYRCAECSHSVDVAHNFGECMPHEHRTGDGSYMPCSGTLLPYAVPKLLHNAASFNLLPPSVELNKTTLRADVAYCVHIDELKDPDIPCGKWRRIVKGMWLGAELLMWGSPVDNSTMYQVRVFKAGVDLNTPSDGTQPTMPDKEALLSDLQSAGGAVYMRQLQCAAAEAQHSHSRLLERLLRLQLVHKEPAAVEAELCEMAAEQQRNVQVGKCTEPAAGAEAHGRWPTPDPNRSTDATVSHQ